MAGFESQIAELDKLGVKVAAASIDPLDKAQGVANEVSFPIGHSVSREIAAALGSFWEDRRGLIQPSEFILDSANNVVVSSYSDGPLGRIDGADVVKLVNFYDSRK